MAATRRKHRLAAGILFLIYFVVLFYFLFFSEKMGRTYSERAYHYNLVPLKEIARFELSLLLELLQLVFRVGSFDVDDLLLNTLGGMAGYGLYRLFVRYYHQRNQRGKESGETT